MRNLILKENNDLKNRYLHISLREKVDIGSLELTATLRKNILSLYDKLLKKEYFGRNEIMNILKMSSSGASKLISKLLELKVIIHVSNHGKGKYIFNIKGVSYE